MNKAPKSLRLHIAIFGRTNVGKSSFLNYITNQDIAITSSVPGTTTDVVEKAMELLPLGPVLFIDTAGLDDKSELSEKRIDKTRKVFNRMDFGVLIVEADIWGDYEEEIAVLIKNRDVPLIIVVNKVDIKEPSKKYLNKIKKYSEDILLCATPNKKDRDHVIGRFKKSLIEKCPDDFINPPSLMGDLIKSGGLSVFIVPIDFEAPKGRLILPQVQSIRDILDNDAGVMVVKENEYRALFNKLKVHPDIVVCDSQVVDKMVENTPDGISCTTFSILFSRFKGDLVEMVKGALDIDKLKKGDKVLIAEACTHHAVQDDIGRVKIPKWLQEYLGFNLDIEVYSGKDYPEDLKKYKLIIHCGACMLNRRQMLSRIQQAKEQKVPITNYGVCISLVQGVLSRVLSPFPKALDVYNI